MKKLYKKAMRYAYVLDHENYRDLVHDAYVYYYKKSDGGNLFEQTDPYVLRCVKFMWKWYRSNTTFHKEFQNYEEAAGLLENTGDTPVFTRKKRGDIDKFSSGDDPHAQLESKDTLEMVTKRVAAYKSGGESSVDPNSLLRVMDYLQRGYTGNEIGTMMDISFQTVSNRKKKIQELIGNFTNNQ